MQDTISIVVPDPPDLIGIADTRTFLLPVEVKVVKGIVQVGFAYYLLVLDPLVRMLGEVDEEEVNSDKQDHQHLTVLEILGQASPVPEDVPVPVVGHMGSKSVDEICYRDGSTTDKQVV